MAYAPIIIPTLNRVEHLKKCISSLANNYDAEKSDLIISVDYPPAEKYRSGYDDVCAYLKQCSFRHSFHSVDIYYQEENLGPYNNAKFLQDKAAKRDSCCIFSEDDNVFSKNFLRYVNEGLKIFENDERVIGICGCKEIDWKADSKDTIAASKLFTAYGVGIWFRKEREIEKKIRNTLLDRKTYSFRSLIALRRLNTTLFNKYVNSVLLGNKQPFWNDKELAVIDSTRSIYMYMTDCICVVPTKNKSLTMGNDGSGVNMKAVQKDVEQLVSELDTEEVFHIVINGKKIIDPNEYDFTDFEYDSQNNSLAEKYMRSATSWKADVKALVGSIYLQLQNSHKGL